MTDNHLLAKIGQYAIISNTEGKILILQRSRSKTWTLPGGRIDQSQNWQESLIEEVKSETGINISNPRPIAVDILTDPYQIKYCVFFTAKTDDLNDIKLSDEHSDLRWIDKNEIDQINFEDEKIRSIIGSQV